MQHASYLRLGHDSSSDFGLSSQEHETSPLHLPTQKHHQVAAREPRDAALQPMRQSQHEPEPEPASSCSRVSGVQSMMRGHVVAAMPW